MCTEEFGSVSRRPLRAGAVILLVLASAVELCGTPPQTLFTPSGYRFDSSLHAAASTGSTAAAVWCSNGSIGDTYGVLFRRSTDQGATWSSPQILNHNTSATIAFEDSAVLASESPAIWGCAWSSEDITAGLAGGVKHILFERSADSAQTWGAPTVLSAATSPTACRHYAPAMTASPAGTWVVVWEAVEMTSTTLGRDGDLLFVRSSDHGQTWSVPAPLNTDAPVDLRSDYLPQIATNGSGTWITAWESRRNNYPIAATAGDYEISYSRSTDDGVTWSAPAPLNANALTDTSYDLSPRLATDAAGNWVAVWTSNWSPTGTGDDDIVFARSVNNGITWSMPAALHFDAAYDTRIDSAPSIGCANGLFSVASEARQKTGTSGSDCDILYCKSGNGGASWSSLGAVNPNPGTDTVDDRSPCVAACTGGASLIAWLAGPSANEGAMITEAPTTTAAADWTLY